MHPRRYETLILCDPDLSPEELEPITGKLLGIIEQMQGRVIRTENWGRRRLAYPVGKKMYGIYWLVDFMGSPQLLLELERNIRIEEQIYKHMSQVLDKNFSEEKYESEIERLKTEAAKREAERAEREAERARREAEMMEDADADNASEEDSQTPVEDDAAGDAQEDDNAAEA